MEKGRVGVVATTPCTRSLGEVSLTVRPALPDDAAGIAAVYAPYVTDTVVSFEEQPPDADAIAGRILRPPRLPWLVATRAGIVTGYASASPHRGRPGYRWSVEVSVYLAREEQGQGTGRLLYAELLEHLTALGYVTAFAGIALPNDASVALHEAVGFSHLGTFERVGFKHGRWIDVGWWQRALSPAVADPEEPRPVGRPTARAASPAHDEADSPRRTRTTR